MTFAAHGILGAGVCMLPWKWCPQPPRTTALIASGVFGFLGGIWPDAFDWAAAAFFGAVRWEWYTRMHAGDLSTGILSYHPAFALHLWVDSFIHDPARPGYDWWQDFWWLEILCWILGAALIWFSIQKPGGVSHDAKRN